jgi:hypothetical protein
MNTEFLFRILVRDFMCTYYSKSKAKGGAKKM